MVDVTSKLSMYERLVVWLFKKELMNLKVIRVKSFGVFLVDTTAGQRMTVFINPWRAIV